MKRIIPVIIAAAAVGLFLAGLLLGDVNLVWEKAAYVCLECIGIG